MNLVLFLYLAGEGGAWFGDLQMRPAVAALGQTLVAQRRGGARARPCHGGSEPPRRCHG